MSERVEVSFLIVNWNGGKTFENALRSIESEASRAGIVGYEIIVVDNNSHDLDEAFLNSIRHLHLIRNDSNRFFAAATNQTVAAAKGEFLFILNNDIVLQKDCLKKLLQPFKDGREPIGVTVPQLRYPDGRTQQSIAGIPKPIDVLYAALLLDKLSVRFDHWINSRFDYTKEQFTTGQPAFSAILMPHSVWQTVGDMDENFPLLWNDVDWFFRFHQTKLRIKYIPSAVVTHIHGMSVNRRPYKKIWTSTTAMYDFFKKSYEPGAVRALGIVLLCALTFTLRILREAAIRLVKKITP